MIYAKAEVNFQTASLHRQDNVVIVCGADDKFAMPLAITMFSAVKNLESPTTPDLYIIDGGISPKNKERIERVLKNTRKVFNLHWVPFDLSSIDSVKETNHISKATYLRILIPDLLPATVEKAIYLDCDMIVEENLMKLWELQFEKELAMGVQDYCYPYITSPNAIPKSIQQSFSTDTVYCNCGLLVLNLKEWRARNLKASIFKFLNDNCKDLINYDQDGINYQIKGQWKVLDPCWNVTLSSVANFGEGLALNRSEIEKYKEQFRRKPFIIHFTSRHKPWHTGYKNKEALNAFYYDQPYRERYFHYLSQSGWFTKVYALYWINHRKMILFFEYKLPRRMKLFFS
jgi:lipopolysaccharide biosynthesis glycosyltransferase